MASRAVISLFLIAGLTCMAVLADDAEKSRLLVKHFALIGGSGTVGILPAVMVIVMVYYVRRRMAAGKHTQCSGLPHKVYVPHTNAASKKVSILERDKDVFAELLTRIQLAWGAGDLERLHPLVTPQMYRCFDEELAANACHGINHKVEWVMLQRANMIEAWREYDRDYASARFEWSAFDYMVRPDRSPADSDYVASGSRNTPKILEEIWTFSRKTGSHWVLSGIAKVA